MLRRFIESRKREFITYTVTAGLCVTAMGMNNPNTTSADSAHIYSYKEKADSASPRLPKGPVVIGSDLQLFVDDYITERLGGKAQLQLHHPVMKEIVIKHDAPWEGSGSNFHSIFKDGDIYRMYYSAWNLSFKEDGKITDGTHPFFLCYAESKDGIHWVKPNLGLHEYQGSKDNNIVMVSGKLGPVYPDLGHPAVFLDKNPDVTPDAKYKAIIRDYSAESGLKGLLAFKSPDGIHWTLMADHAVITDGAFDSQNLAFWDESRKEYRAYWRWMSPLRAIRTASSKDFIHWTNQADLTYVNSPVEQLYINVIKTYERAPQLLMGFPVRYTEHPWSPSMEALPELEHRKKRSQTETRFGTAISEALFMVSRDGVKFKRWNEAFLRPGIERKGTWNYGHQYMGWHVVQTKSDLEGAPDELSLYTVESYWTDNSSELRRYTLRLDGFVSVNAPMSGGEVVTRPVTFTGKNLLLNFSTSAAGEIKVELQDKHGKPIPGFTLNDCEPVFGDTIERPVYWKKGADVSKLKGKTIRVRFVMKDADLYAFRFK
ncbi:hypothetical protein [Chitinophaga sp. MM2321]|uniref:hypothetical protein n=1 Tax=Chitinophaga sp. MM2321 TaxID=3137178 RepID=UPI0032D56E70